MPNDQEIRAMTDRELSLSLRDAERDGDTDNIIYFENEILARINYDVEDLSHGLTPDASLAIDKFVRDNGVR